MVKTKKIIRDNQETIILRNIRKDFFGIILVILNSKPEGQILFVDNKWHYLRNTDIRDSQLNHDSLSKLLDHLKEYYHNYRVVFEVIEYDN